MRLIDADALDKRIYNDVPISTFGSIRRMSAVRELIEEAPTVEPASPWHRVEDGLPDKFGSYLVYAPTYRGGSSSEKECKAGVMFARWLKGGHWSIEVGYYKRPGCVTHWMPIEPPKEEE